MRINQVREIQGFEWRWPADSETFSRTWEFDIDEGGRTSRMRHALGTRNVFGRDRVHSVTWQNERPMVEGAEADDYGATRGLISILKGADGKDAHSRSGLQRAYRGFQVVVHREEIDGPRARSGLAVKIVEDDLESWAAHALARSRQHQSRKQAGGLDQKPKADGWLLTWNPTLFPWPNLGRDLKKYRRDGSIKIRWSCGRTRRIRPGDLAFLMRLGVEPKGIVGAGVVCENPTAQAHWNESDTTALYVRVLFHALDDAPIVPIAELERRWSRVRWTPQASGISIHARVAGELEQLVENRTGITAEEAEIAGVELVGPFVEGRVVTQKVNAYERNPRARNACIVVHGTACKVCGFEFRAGYGEIGAGFIHVHHTVPLSEIGDSYQVDPKRDMVPLCPNCHAMAHRASSPLSVVKLKGLVRRHRNT